MTSTQTISYGQIKKITLPPNSLKVDASSNLASFSCVYYHPPDFKDTRIYFMGHLPPLDDKTANGLTKIIKMDAKKITFTDFETISTILRSADDHHEFLIKAVLPKTIKDKEVLIIEGHWQKRNWDTYWILIPIIDQEHDSVFLQELIYSSPSEQYLKFYNEAIVSINSLEWQ